MHSVLTILCHWVNKQRLQISGVGIGAVIWIEDKVTASPKLRTGPGEAGRAGS